MVCTTLTLCKKIRPNAKWGFYGLPLNLASPCVIENNTEYCGYDDPTNGYIYRSYSDTQIPIWKASDVIYPSIYIPSESMDILQISAYINNTVKESLRCAINGGNNQYSRKLVYPYMWMRYHNGIDLLSYSCLNMSVKYPYEHGADGVVIWGGVESNTSSFWEYLQNFSGPVIYNTVTDVQYCANTVCNGHGRCIYLPELIGSKNQTCECDDGWYGSTCSQPL